VGCSECGPTRTAAFAGVVWASQGRLVHRLDAADGHELGSTAVLPTRRGTDVAAIAADAAGATAAWTSGWARLAPEIALRGPARAAAASLNGRILWIATAPRTLEALDARSGRRLGPTVGTAVAATALAPGPRGVRVASPGSLEPVEPLTGRRLRRLPAGADASRATARRSGRCGMAPCGASTPQPAPPWRLRSSCGSTGARRASAGGGRSRSPSPGGRSATPVSPRGPAAVRCAWAPMWGSPYPWGGRMDCLVGKGGVAWGNATPAAERDV
jgi:hypothetical protein